MTDRVRLPGGAVAVALEGLHRGVAGAAETDTTGRLLVEVEERRDGATTDERTRELEREYRAVVEEILELRGDDGRIQAFIRSIGEPGTLADTSGYSPDLGFEQKVKLLETVDVTERLELALSFQRERLSTMQIRQRIREDVNAGMEKQQREYLLRKQMDSIRKELGEDDASVVEEYRAKIAEADMPEAVREQADKELARFERMGEQSPESQMIRSYLDWLLAVPWGVTLGRGARPDPHPRGAGRRPRGPRGREGPHRRVHRRREAPQGARDRGRQACGRDPHADRAARHRQDVDRRVGREGPEPRVRPHVARRRA